MGTFFLRFSDLPKEQLFDFLSENTKRSHLEIGRRLFELNVITEGKFKEYFPNRPVTKPTSSNTSTTTTTSTVHKQKNNNTDKNNNTAPSKKTTRTTSTGDDKKRKDNISNSGKGKMMASTKPQRAEEPSDDDDGENINLEDIFASARQRHEGSNTDSSQASLPQEESDEGSPIKESERRKEKGPERNEEKGKRREVVQSARRPETTRASPVSTKGPAVGSSTSPKPSSPVSPAKRYGMYLYFFASVLIIIPLSCRRSERRNWNWEQETQKALEVAALMKSKRNDYER